MKSTGDEPFNWGEFEKTMLNQFPFLPKNFRNTDPIRNPAWVGDYVHKVLQDAFSLKNQFRNGFKPPSSTIQNYQLFETLHAFILQVPLPKRVSLSQVSIAVSNYRVKVELPSGKKLEIKLDKRVNPTRTKASFKNGILELHMPKSKGNETFHTVRVND